MNSFRKMHVVGFLIGAASALACPVSAADWPMLGRDGTRNSVSREVGAPTNWITEERKDGQATRSSHGIRWSAPLGSQTLSSPVVSGGFVWIGTNNIRQGVKSNQNNSALLCFRVTDGKQVYEYLSPHLGARIHDAGWAGLGSSPLIEGDRLWLTTNRSEVICLDIGSLMRGEGPPRELWKLDLIKTFDIFVHVPLMGPPRPCSIGPSWNGRIFVTTNNGVDNSRTNIPKPDAPSLVCLDKKTGEVYWIDNSPRANILLTQMASPTVVEIHGQVQVIVPQSDGWVRSFDPMTGEKLWEFDVNPKVAVHSLDGRSNRNSLLGNAVVYEDRVYLASGQDAEHGAGPGRLVCIDPTKRGDVSSELAVDAEGKLLPRRRRQAVDSQVGEKAIENPNSALVWEFVSNGKKFEDQMHRTMGSVAIANGLLVVTDFSGLVHCFDARTGQRHWSHEILSQIWTSPLIVDDKIYVSDDEGNVSIFGLNADSNLAMRKSNKLYEPLEVVPMGQSILSSPIFSNGVLYLATSDELFAIAHENDEPELLPAARTIQLNIPKSSSPAAVNDGSDTNKLRTLRSVFVPTPQDVVEKMLEVAKLQKSDLVYDLGSGDGRIVITAAQKYRCNAVGFEIDRALVESSRAKAKEANVAELVTFEHKDLFTADLSKADVVMVYLLPAQLEKLAVNLKTMKPGSRLISHQFEIPGFSTDRSIKVESIDDGAQHSLYTWTLPLKKVNE